MQHNWRRKVPSEVDLVSVIFGRTCSRSGQHQEVTVWPVVDKDGVVAHVHELRSSCQQGARCCGQRKVVDSSLPGRLNIILVEIATLPAKSVTQARALQRRVV